MLGIGRHLATLREAKRRGAVDRFSTEFRDVREADLVVIATPVATVVPQVRKLLPFVRPGTVLTDVGSVKQSILSGVARLKLPRSVSYVGGHPLAGSHKTGVRWAHPDLFKGSTCVLVPLGKASVASLQRMWCTTGARPIVLTAKTHDRAVALISHLPHILAHALVHSVAGHPQKKSLLPLLAGSFRDVTRVASSDPEQWQEILQANAAEVRHAIHLFRRQLSRLERHLSKASLRALLKQSHTFRRPLFHGV